MKEKNTRLKRLKRLSITGIICIITAIIIIGINIVSNSKWYEYISVVSLFIAGLVFIYTSSSIRIKISSKSKSIKKWYWLFRNIIVKLICDLVMEQYSRGWRGAPAKGIGRVTGARVQISPAPPLS